MRSPLSVYGVHRVLEPKGTLPQGALKVDNTPRLQHPHELIIDVKSLLLDATSMKQIMETSGNDPKRATDKIIEIVAKRGKMHNPTTHSGGVLIGDIREIGSRFFDIHPPENGGKSAGQTIIPVASLSTLPLHIQRVNVLHGNQVVVEGSAVMFACMKICPIPKDFSLELALACIDISSLPPQVNRCLANLLLVDRKEPVRILILGCGKAGITALYCIREMEKFLRKNRMPTPQLQVLAVDSSASYVNFARTLHLADAVEKIDARNAEELYSFAMDQTGGSLCDLVINVVNTPNSEAPTVLCTRDRSPKGSVLWFSMATRFDQAALATDALGKDVLMTIGNGVADGQVETIFALIRGNPSLRAFLEESLNLNAL